MSDRDSLGLGLRSVLGHVNNLGPSLGGLPNLHTYCTKYRRNTHLSISVSAVFTSCHRTDVHLAKISSCVAQCYHRLIGPLLLGQDP